MLIVEDDDLSQNLMRRVFRADFDVSICDSSEEYYEKYSRSIFDIIIMDVSLKGTKNGLELTKEIKSDPSYSGTPIICLTAHAQTMMRQTAIESGTDYFITKPISNKILKETVRSLLKSGPGIMFNTL
ncbi:MAG: response regulator [Ignavibacteriaceae bacterium]